MNVFFSPFINSSYQYSKDKSAFWIKNNELVEDPEVQLESSAVIDINDISDIPFETPKHRKGSQKKREGGRPPKFEIKQLKFDNKNKNKNKNKI